MNIFRVFNTISYPLFIYLLFSRRILVESNGTSASPSQSYGAGADTKSVGSNASLAGGEQAENGYSSTDVLRVFKTDGDGNLVEMQASDFYEDRYLDNHTYAFKQNVKCTLIKFGRVEVWKKGDHGVDEPKSVSYTFMHRIVVRNSKTSLVYRKDDSGNWVHHRTIERTETDNTAKTSSQTAPEAGSPSSGSSSSKEEPETASTGAPESTEVSGETDGTSDVSSVEGGSTHSTPGNDTHTDRQSGDGSHVTTPPPGGADGRSSDGSTPVAAPATNLSGSGTTPPAATNEAKSSTNPPENGGSSSTLPANPGGDRSAEGGGASPQANVGSGTSPTSGGDTQATQTNDLMEKFDKLVGDKLEPSDYLKDIKLFKADPNDTTKTKELTTSDYKVKKHADENLYVLNHGVNCTLIKRDNNDLWKYDSSKSDAKYPKGMNVENDLIFIYFGEYTEAYSKSTGEWKLSSTVKKDLSSLKVMADVDKSKQDRT